MQTGFCAYKYRTLLIAASFSSAIEYILLFTDKIIIGNILGETAFSATDMITPLFSIVVFVSTIISTETAKNSAYYIGRFDGKRANEYFGQGVLLSIIAGVALLAVAFLGKLTYFDFLGLSDELSAYASEYYGYYQYTVLFYPAYALLARVVFEDGDEWNYISSVFVRVVGNAVISVILCRRMGIAGAGIGTLASTILGLAVLLLHFFKRNNSLTFVPHFDLGETADTFKSGFPSAVTYLYQAAVVFILSKFFVMKLGEQYLPVLSVVNAMLAVTAVFGSVGQATEPLCHVYLGERNEVKIRQVFRMATKTALFFGIAAAGCFLIFSGKLVGIIELAEDTTRLSVTAIWIIAPSLVFIALFYLLSCYYGMIGSNKIYMLLSGLYEMILPLLIAVPLGLLVGVNGVWIGFAASPLITLAVCLLAIQKQRDIRRLSLLPEQDDDAAVRSFDLVLSPQSIMQVRNEAAKLLAEHEVCDRTRHNIMLLIEEIFMLVLEKNKGKKVYAECTIRIDGDDVQLILRDSGKIFDVTDSDLGVSSLRSFLLASMMERQQDKAHIVATSYNRNAFRFQRTA